MKLIITEQNNQVLFAVEGRLDTTTFSEFEDALQPYFVEQANLVFDFAQLEYLSSAGLRVLLRSQQKLDDLNGSLKILNSNEEIMEVFEITGFVDILTLE